MCLPQPFQVVFPHTSQVVGRHMIVSFVVAARIRQRSRAMVLRACALSLTVPSH